jgi:hypothetical protein
VGEARTGSRTLTWLPLLIIAHMSMTALLR